MIGANADFAKKYFAHEIAKREAEERQPVYSKPAESKDLARAVQRYALSELSRRIAPSGFGYGAARSGGALGPIRNEPSSRDSIEAKLYEAKASDRVSDTFVGHLERESIDSLIGIDPSPHRAARSSRSTHYNAALSDALRGYLN